MAASGVGYHLTGFTPGAELELTLTLPTGESAGFSSLDPIVPDANGEYTGVITYSGAWPEGEYTVSVRTADGDTVQQATFVFEVARVPAGGGATGGGSNGSDTGGSQGSSAGSGLAATGADVFGPAGLGLLVLAAGAAVAAGGWLLRRRTDDAS